MKTKEKTLQIRRERQEKHEKLLRSQYLQAYLPRQEFALLTTLKNFN